MTQVETIAAPATPPGRGGIGVIRVSGPLVYQITESVCGRTLRPRYATHCWFHTAEGCAIDEGIALLFTAPHSFTGEDVLELQGHGGPIVMDRLLTTVIAAGARLANPGEFSERAFLNHKIDLVQAEAIADLIDASSQQAAMGAISSLRGDFSHYINKLLVTLIDCRKYVEAAIDFPDEEIDFLSDSHIHKIFKDMLAQLQAINDSATQGQLLRDGMTIVLAGLPNVGKSSLLNILSGEDNAIVTPIAGTTRDLLKASIQIHGMPLHIIDTAGLQVATDEVEKIGIQRAQQAMQKADGIVLVVEATDINNQAWQDQLRQFEPWINKMVPLIVVANKIDLINHPPQKQQIAGQPIIYLSAKQNEGVDLLKSALTSLMGFKQTTETTFTARRRHLQAIKETESHLTSALDRWLQHRAPELLAEDLRLAQQTLAQITGDFHADDLLGEIFSSFCLGK